MLSLTPLDFSVDFAADQNRCPGKIKPEHQDNQRPERSIGDVVGIEEM
jgi:hypothetical protein